VAAKKKTQVKLDIRARAEAALGKTKGGDGGNFKLWEPFDIEVDKKAMRHQQRRRRNLRAEGS
jgi:hypothetical protein